MLYALGREATPLICFQHSCSQHMDTWLEAEICCGPPASASISLNKTRCKAGSRSHERGKQTLIYTFFSQQAWYTSLGGFTWPDERPRQCRIMSPYVCLMENYEICFPTHKLHDYNFSHSTDCFLFQKGCHSFFPLPNPAHFFSLMK